MYVVIKISVLWEQERPADVGLFYFGDRKKVEIGNMRHATPA